jgi:hypothetical protein
MLERDKEQGGFDPDSDRTQAKGNENRFRGGTTVSPKENQNPHQGKRKEKTKKQGGVPRKSGRKRELSKNPERGKTKARDDDKE